MSYADSHELNTHDIPTIAQHLANLPKKNTQRKRIAIVTQGTDPTVIAVQGESSVNTYPVHKIGKEEIVDTTGAGDAFAGGFFAGVAKGESMEKCVDMGQWLAALSLRELGPSYVIPPLSLYPEHSNPSAPHKSKTGAWLTSPSLQLPVPQQDLHSVFLDATHGHRSRVTGLSLPLDSDELRRICRFGLSSLSF